MSHVGATPGHYQPAAVVSRDSPTSVSSNYKIQLFPNASLGFGVTIVARIMLMIPTALLTLPLSIENVHWSHKICHFVRWHRICPSGVREKEVHSRWLILTRHLVLHARAVLGTTLFHNNASDPASNTKYSLRFLPPHAYLLPGIRRKLKRPRCLKYEHDRTPQTKPAHFLFGCERLDVEQGLCGGVDGFVISA